MSQILTEDLLDERAEIKGMQKNLKERLDEIDKIIRDECQVGMNIDFEHYKVEVVERSRTGVDKDKLRSEYKKVYEDVEQTTFFNQIKVVKK